MKITSLTSSEKQTKKHVVCMSTAILNISEIIVATEEWSQLLFQPTFLIPLWLALLR